MDYRSCPENSRPLVATRGFESHTSSTLPQYSPKDGGLTVNQVPIGWLGALPRCGTIFVVIAQGIGRLSPKQQVEGSSPSGDSMCCWPNS